MSDRTFGLLDMAKPRYLGDGVYASFDGYQIQLHVNAHDAPVAVSLEPNVLVALMRYAKDLNDAITQINRMGTPDNRGGAPDGQNEGDSGKNEEDSGQS